MKSTKAEGTEAEGRRQKGLSCVAADEEGKGTCLRLIGYAKAWQKNEHRMLNERKFGNY